jgi:hypothetical protein
VKGWLTQLEDGDVLEHLTMNQLIKLMVCIAQEIKLRQHGD